MLESKEFRRTIMPVVVINSIFCTGLLEYFSNRSTHVIGFVYITFAVSSYSAMFYMLLLIVHQAWGNDISNLSALMMHFQFCNNIVVYGMTILGGIIRRKQVRLSVKHLENCVRAMDELGISGSYSALVRHKYVVLFCISSVLLSTTIGEFMWLTHTQMNPTMVIIFCITENIPPVSSLIIDFSFVFWIRYTKVKLGQLNTELRSMLTTTIDSPQHKRVLRFRDKQKNASPVSNNYRNYKTDENVRKLKRIKEIHLELIKFARNMNEAFGLHILMSMTTCFLLMTTLLYNMYVAMISSEFEMKWTDIYVFVYWVSFLAFEVVAVNHTCAIAAMEVREFAQQLVQNPLTFTACGFFDLDHTFINSTIGSVTTYLVILIQVGHGSQDESKNVIENSTSTIV